MARHSRGLSRSQDSAVTSSEDPGYRPAPALDDKVPVLRVHRFYQRMLSATSHLAGIDDGLSVNVVIGDATVLMAGPTGIGGGGQSWLAVAVKLEFKMPALTQTTHTK